MSDVALHGWVIDLLTDGVPLDSENPRGEVITAVRSVMLSAHRVGADRFQVFGLLMDVDRRRLAKQLATGRGGRTIGVVKRRELLTRLWSETHTVAAKRGPWNRDDVEDMLTFVRDNLDGTDTLNDRERAVMAVVLSLAEAHGTTRPAVPSRVVADRTGIPLPTANRILRRIAAEGEWLRLAKKGNRHTGRASLYVIAPALLNVWGASPPMSHTEPMSHPPMSHSEGDAMNMSITVAANSEEALRQALRVIANADPDEVRRAMSETDAPVRHLSVVGGDA